MINYIRYITVLIILVFVFFLFKEGITINKDVVSNMISKKLPIEKEGYGAKITVHNLELVSVNTENYEHEVEFKINASIESSKIMAFFTGSEDIVVTGFAIPEIYGNILTLNIQTLSTNSKSKIIKKALTSKMLINFISNYEIKIKKLENISFFLEVKEIEFNEDLSLTVNLGVPIWMVLLAVTLLLLREIGLLFIYIYQKLFSPMKGYKCSLGVRDNNGTCSSITKKAFKEYGFIRGMRTYFQTTRECKVAHIDLMEARHDNCNCSSISPSKKSCDDAFCVGSCAACQSFDDCGSC